MAIIKDDWEKPRTKGMKLNAAEIARLRVAFNTRTHPRDIARELKCSSRVTSKYYAMFRGRPHQRHAKPKIVAPVREPKPLVTPRFYTSNFELEG
jgi:hypothetical protein